MHTLIWLIFIHLLRFLIENLHSWEQNLCHHNTVNETAADRSFTPSLTHLDCGALTPAIIVCKIDTMHIIYSRRIAFVLIWVGKIYALSLMGQLGNFKNH